MAVEERRGCEYRVVSLSGGKDSTAMLLMMIERGERIDEVVFFDWQMEFPEMYVHLDRLEAHIGRRITRLQAPQTMEHFMFDYLKVRGASAGKRGYGWPHWRRRWCTRIKLGVLQKYTGGATVSIGIAVDETPRRSRAYTTYISPLFGDSSPDPTRRFPLVEWNVGSRETLRYCKARGFDWGGLYGRPGVRHISCWCCALQNRSALVALHHSHPSLWRLLLDMDARSPFPWPGKSLEQAKGDVT